MVVKRWGVGVYIPPFIRRKTYFPLMIKKKSLFKIIFCLVKKNSQFLMYEIILIKIICYDHKLYQMFFPLPVSTETS